MSFPDLLRAGLLRKVVLLSKVLFTVWKTTVIMKLAPKKNAWCYKK